MIIGYAEAKEISGRFYEFEYETTVTRNPTSQNFGCFKDNKKRKFKVVQKVYCWDDRCFDHIMNNWSKAANGLLSMYSYKGLGKTTQQSFNATQVIERMYANGVKNCANLITLGSIDIIQ